MSDDKNRESVKDGPHIPATHQIKAAATRTWSVGEFDRWLAAHDREVKAEAWDEGVETALNHAILNPDKITLRLEHLDGRPWVNPYRRTE